MSTEQARPENSAAPRGIASTMKLMTLMAAGCMFIGLAAIFAPGELIIAALGMIPTAAAAIVDTSPRRSITQCVGAMNFAGVSAVMALAWNAGGTMDAALGVLVDPYSWLVMLVGAAVGWALTWAGRVVATRLVAHVVDHQVGQLRDYQAKLVAEWGRRILDEK